jgi:hypothetical protein
MTHSKTLRVDYIAPDHRMGYYQVLAHNEVLLGTIERSVQLESHPRPKWVLIGPVVRRFNSGEPMHFARISDGIKWLEAHAIVMMEAAIADDDAPLIQRARDALDMVQRVTGATLLALSDCLEDETSDDEQESLAELLEDIDRRLS